MPRKRAKRSQGELTICAYLEEKCIHFEEQKMFPETGRLRYDFFLPDFNLLIEMDGRQHFEPFRNNPRGRRLFKIRREYDKRKDVFANQHIPLLRIAYTCKNRIPQVLDKYLQMTLSKGVYYSKEEVYSALQSNTFLPS